MDQFFIMTDSSCDLPAETVTELGIGVVPLKVTLDGETFVNYLDEREITFSDFYARMRKKCQASTTSPSITDFSAEMESALSAGHDVLYIGFSSALSATYNTGVIAAEELASKYPDRKIYTVDSLAASLGQGLLVYLAVQQQRLGKTIEEVRDYVEATKLHIAHWFTVADLFYLQRGGRLSSATAILGTVLSIKPILHTNDHGQLDGVSKCRGRKNSLVQLADLMIDQSVDLKNNPTFICHSDCLAEVQIIVDRLQAAGAPAPIVVNFIGPVIGAHTGPGTIGVFFLADKR